MSIPHKKKCIGITLGDPAGIGPEVVARALARPAIRRLGPFKLIGDYAVYRKYCSVDYAGCPFIDMHSIRPDQWRAGRPNHAGARASWRALLTAVELLKREEISGLVTAPVCKEALRRVAPSFRGHTEFLADAFGVKKVGMMFAADSLRTILVTRHIPLNKVSETVNAANVLDAIRLAHAALKNSFGIRRPAIGVCGLNPHAGEGGTIGKEEITKIIPAIRKARRQKINACGPFAADTLFSPAAGRRFDAVVAMYHDQGLIPAKALWFTKVVNLTIGLPFIRTSPAHGTAFDIAGTRKADPSSMCEAIKLAVRLSK